jgi:hypothetical protein
MRWASKSANTLEGSLGINPLHREREKSIAAIINGTSSFKEFIFKDPNAIRESLAL